MHRFKKTAGNFKIYILLLIILFHLAWCTHSCNKGSKSPSPTAERIFISPKDSVSFMVIGDWGQDGIQTQVDVARQMMRNKRIFNTQFIIASGDNFYPFGVKDINDPHWQLSFEKVYLKDSLPIKWFPVLGNHDYMLNPQAQIEYSSLSDRWSMPSRYYAVKRKIDGADSVLLVFTDTSPFISPYYGTQAVPMADLKKQDTAAQIRWIRSTLSASKETWKIMIGHHPVYSVGYHGNSPDLIRLFKPILVENKVDFYVAGHDHDLQHTKQPDQPIHYLVSGGGSEHRPVTPDSNTLFAKSIPGFLQITLYSDNANIYFYDKDGSLLHQQKVSK